MPQPAQNSLIHVLLLWITLLSIVQAAFMILFFTAERHGLSHNTTTPEHKVQSKAHDASLLSPGDNSLHLVQAEMITYKLTQDNGKIRLEARDPNNRVISEKGSTLHIMEDGFYFLSLQVTVKGHYSNCTGIKSPCKVSLKRNKEVLLEGSINSNTCSTGLLGKVETLSSGTILEVDIMSNEEIDESESLTHMDIIMLKPKRMQ